jgi:hypothetical protein
MHQAFFILVALFAGVLHAEADDAAPGDAKLADDVLVERGEVERVEVERVEPESGESAAATHAASPEHDGARAPTTETARAESNSTNDEDQWIGTVSGAGLGGAVAGLGAALGLAALIGVGYVGLASVFALSPSETPTYTIADVTSPFMLVIALALVAQGLVLTLTTALALDTVTDFWRAALLAPLCGLLGALGAPVGFIVGATLTTLALAGVFALMRGGSIGSNDGAASGAVFIGVFAGTFVGAPLGVVVSNLLLPTVLVAMHAGPLAEWRVPFTSFSE